MVLLPVWQVYIHTWVCVDSINVRRDVGSRKRLLSMVITREPFKFSYLYWINADDSFWIKAVTFLTHSDLVAFVSSYWYCNQCMLLPVQKGTVQLCYMLHGLRQSIRGVRLFHDVYNLLILSAANALHRLRQSAVTALVPTKTNLSLLVLQKWYMTSAHTVPNWYELKINLKQNILGVRSRGRIRIYNRIRFSTRLRIGIGKY